MEAEEKCLVCGSDPGETPLRSITEPFPHSDDIEPNGSHVLSAQLSVLFVLRKVLRLDRETLEDVLSKTGSNPASWNLKLCRVCYRVVEESNFVFVRLRKLHFEFEDLSRRLYAKLVKSRKPDETSSKVTPPVKRKAGRPRRKDKTKIMEMKQENHVQEVTEESFNSVTDRIRMLVFKNVGKDVAPTQEHAAFDTLAVEDHFPFPAPVHHNYSIKVEFSKPPPEEEILEDPMIDIDTSNFQETNGLMEDSFVDDDYGPPEPMDIVNDDSQNNSGDDARDDDFEDASENEDDSDFEISSRPRSKRKQKSNSNRSRTKRKPVDPGLIAKSVPIENTNAFICPKCHAIFETAETCDDHIVIEHYGGKWPKPFSCHLCTDLHFRGENMLRLHYQTAHPGVKLPNDVVIERYVGEGAMPELTYEVIPVGFKTTFPEQPPKANITDGEDPEAAELINRTVDEPPPNAFSIPIAHAQSGHSVRYLVLPKKIKDLPDVYPLLQTGIKDKSCPHDGCDMEFPTEMQLRGHVKRVHEGQEFPYECPMCTQKFERIGKTLIHVQRKHILAENACDTCGMYFKESILLLAHIQRNHFGVDNPYKCIKCDVRYPRRSILNKHLKRTHNLQIASYELLFKNKKSKSASGSKVRRKRRLKNAKKYVCNTCVNEGKKRSIFFNQEDLDAHIKRRHEGIPRPYPCPICGKRYSKPSVVEKHMEVHTVRNDVNINDAVEVKTNNALPFVCVACDKQFKTQSLLNVHFKSKNHSAQGSYVCEICSQGFYGLKYLQNHQSQKHHKELNIDPNKCKYCDKILSSARSLKEHVQLKHTKNARLKCPHCDSRFLHESTMEQHINASHTKSLQFLCPECPKTFWKDFYLKNHIARVHSGQKPHECSYCLKTFSDKSTYNRHVESHSSVVHTCLHCGKSGFKTRHALRVHMKTFHREILEEEDRQKKLAELAPEIHPEFSNDASSTASSKAISKIEPINHDDQLPTLDCFVGETDPLAL